MGKNLLVDYHCSMQGLRKPGSRYGHGKDHQDVKNCEISFTFVLSGEIMPDLEKTIIAVSQKPLLHVRCCDSHVQLEIVWAVLKSSFEVMQSLAIESKASDPSSLSYKGGAVHVAFVVIQSSETKSVGNKWYQGSRALHFGRPSLLHLQTREILHRGVHVLSPAS
jgi:hypothetical protein